MSRSYQSIIMLTLVAILAACGGSSSDGDTSKAKGAASAPVSSAALSDAARFDRDYRKKGCELLTAELAGATFGIPATDLKQFTFMGCSYIWKSDTETVEAGVSLIQAHKSEAGAAGWFANATRNKTAEEVQAEMDNIAEQVDKKMAAQKIEGLDTAAKKSLTKGLLGMAGSKAVNFEDLAAVGDEARVNEDGNIYVRVDNLTFIVSAYKGAVAQPFDMKGMNLTEKGAIAKLTKLSQQHDAEWAQKTAPQRKTDGSKLAKAIVAEL